jgi:hypothetical protein
VHKQVLPETHARAAGWVSLQFTKHSADYGQHPKAEIVDLQLLFWTLNASREGALLPRYYADANGTRPCIFLWTKTPYLRCHTVS